MRIYDRNSTGAAASESGRAQETQRIDQEESARRGAAGADSVGDRVELSSTLARLSGALAAHGSHRASRVQALAAQYQAGKYQPGSAATAGGMVAEALSMGSD